MASKITLTWVSVPVEDTELIIFDSLRSTVNMSEVFKIARTQVGETPLNSDLNAMMFRYAKSFGLDYNTTNLYVVSNDYEAKTTTITANNITSVFSVISNTTGGAITTSLDNDDPIETFDIESVVISESDINACENVKITITTSELADSLESPITKTITENPFEIDIERSDLISINVLKDVYNARSEISVPKLLSTYFDIQVINTPSLASVNVNKSFTYVLGFDLEYSIDNVDWQESKNFNSVPVGSHTIYIRDSIGCSIEIPFEVDEFTPNLADYDGICEVSNINSIRYKYCQDWSIYPKTSRNTLSFEENIDVRNNSFLQLFQTNDTVRTQIKTNYKNISAKIISSLGEETNLDVVQRSANMGISDVRDGETVDYTYMGSNYVAVTFKNGYTYDSTTLEELNAYNLGETLPDWLNIGDYVNIEGAGWYEVLDLAYTNDANAIVLNLLSDEFYLSHGTKKITSVYNAVDYERYEFDIDFSTYNGYYKVQIDITDDVFEDRQYLSEWLHIKEEHKNTYLIKAYNSVFNEINFSTGYYTILRLPYAKKLEWSPNTERDIYVTDTNTVSIESKYRSFWVLSLKPLPSAMAEKVVLILSQDRLFIDEVNYVNENEPESKKVGGQYQISAELVESNYVFDSNLGKGVSEVTTYEGIPLAIYDDAPGLLFVED